ncbi:MAG: leucine-rich repeat domain-containing protein [Muribaculaceae bacterium]
MFRHLYLPAAALLIAALGAEAETLRVDCTPGELAASVESPESVTDLVITGTVNAADLFFMGQQLPNLQTLAMGTAAIAEYQGPKLHGRQQWPANTIPEGAFAGCPATTIHMPTAEGLAIQQSAFAGSALQTLNLLTTISSVGDGAFAGCPALTEVYMPGISSYGNYIFAGCKALTKAKLAVQTLPEGTFADCSALATLEGADLVRNIGKYAFANCSSLRHYAVSPNLYVIDEGAFMRSGLEAFDASAAASFTVVGPWAFAYCASLSEVHLSNAIVKLGEGAFFDCTQLTAAILPPEVRQVSNYLFKGTAAVTTDNVNISGATAIGDYAMARMEGLGSITIPGTITSVGEGAFLGLKASMIYAQALEAVPATGADAFAEVDCPAVTLYVADDMYDDFSTADQWREFNIVKYSSDVTDARTTITLEGTPALKARFVGTDLEVSIDGLEIAWIALYNEAGLLLTAVEPDADIVTIATAQMQAHVFIVSARLADGRDASLKIARR